MFAVCSAISVASSVAAPASITKQNAIWVVANTRKRRLVPGVMRRLPEARLDPVGAWPDGSLRNVREQDRRGHRERGANPQQG